MRSGTTLMRVTWYEYVREIAGTEPHTTIGYKLGIAGTTVGRWKGNDPSRGEFPDPKDVIKFAEVYEVSLKEAIVKAGYISEEELGAKLPVADARRVSSAGLVIQIARRLGVGWDDLQKMRAALGEAPAGQPEPGAEQIPGAPGATHKRRPSRPSRRDRDQGHKLQRGS